MRGVLTRNGLTVAGLAQPIDVITGPNTGEIGQRVYIGPTDPVSDLPVFVDFDHHQNHEGEAYQYHYYNAALNGTVDFRLSVPAYTVPIRAPHFSFELTCDTTSNLLFYEAPTVTLTGTAVTTIVNRNRIGTPNAPGLQILTGATFSAVGTELTRYVTIVSARASIATDSSKAEWILKPSTDYLARLSTSAPTIGMLRMNWYEDLGT